MTDFTAAELGAVAFLSSPALIRLIAEIDDNGAIPPRRLAGILHDLPSWQLRRAIKTARAHHLIRTEPGSGLELTPSGSELADLYDATARWARRRAFPQPACDFSGRIRHTLSLLARSTQPGAVTDMELSRLRALLIRWLTDNAHLTTLREPDRDSVA